MKTAEYRLFFDNNPATREQLDRMEEITVQQEVDMAWQARLRLPIYTNQSGRWQNENEPFMADFARVRVEIKVGDNPFVPLIDGPIVGNDSNRSSEPGQSSITLVVHDDSVFLNRQERVESFQNMNDHEIAEQLFSETAEIAATDVEQTPRAASSLPTTVMQRGTAMQILRALARRQGYHAYVLPGGEPGASVGYFKPFTTELSNFPPLILLGSERNIESFNVSGDAQRPSQVQAFALNITDKAVLTSASSYRNLDLLGTEFTFENEDDTAVQLAPPDQGDAVDLDRRVAAQAERDSYAFQITGNVIADCYPGVLLPYQVINARGVNDRLSGNYLISSVTHTLSRLSYSQSFTLKKNALSAGTVANFNDLVGSIF